MPISDDDNYERLFLLLKQITKSVSNTLGLITIRRMHLFLFGLIKDIVKVGDRSR